MTFFYQYSSLLARHTSGLVSLLVNIGGKNLPVVTHIVVVVVVVVVVEAVEAVEGVGVV